MGKINKKYQNYPVAGFFIISLVISFVCGCGGVNKKVKKGEIINTVTQTSIQKKHFEAIGIGAADPSMKNITQKKATSRNAAIVAAQYEMLSMIKGVKVCGGITVEKSLETGSKMQTVLADMIKGAEIVQTEWTADDGCVVTIRLNKKKAEKALDVKFED